MYEVNNGVVKVDGASGKYNNGAVTNPSVQYGRNAVENYYSYMEKPLTAEDNVTPPILDFSTNPNATDNNINKMEKYVKDNDDYLNALPPLEFEYRYMPNLHKKGDVDRGALLGAAYEELGKRKEVSVQEMSQVFTNGSDLTIEPLDINKDGKIDIAEYSTNILTADMLSKSEKPDTANIDGTINNKGMERVMKYAQKSNAEAAANLYTGLYNKYNLADAVKDFNP